MKIESKVNTSAIYSSTKANSLKPLRRRGIHNGTSDKNGVLTVKKAITLKLEPNPKSRKHRSRKIPNSPNNNFKKMLTKNKAKNHHELENYLAIGGTYKPDFGWE